MTNWLRQGWAGVAVLSVWCVGCGKNAAPVFDPIDDATAIVGVEFALELRASDADGDKLRFSVSAPAIPDLQTRESPATIQSFADGVAIFRWVPTSADRSETPYAFDFAVNDGKTTTTETIQLTVKDSAGSAPIFRQPLGTGSTLDLDKTDTIEIKILVEDTDSTATTLGQNDPPIEGAELSQTGPFEGTWTWTPTAEQIAARDRYTLTLTAEDEEGNKAVPKSYLIVLRKSADPSCPGTPPEITHLPPSGVQSTINDIKITATVTDDIGMKSPPLFFYSTPDPTSTPVQLSMTLVSGDDKDGTYEGIIPNPVASAAAGTKQTVYYTIVATDNDDAAGTACDKTTESPTSGTFMVEVQKPTTTTPGLGVCEGPCTNDAQCGGDQDHCIQIGTSGKFFCSRICGAGNPACPDGYNCSTSVVSSIGGASARQCLPKSGTCVSAAECVEDNLEQNDTRTNIVNTTSQNITKATDVNKTNTQTYTQLAMCVTDGLFDEDWYGIALSTTAANTMVNVRGTVKLGADFADVDFDLLDPAGTFVDGSFSSGAAEEISACIPKPTVSGMAKAFLNAYSIDDPKPGFYDLIVTTTPDDTNEPNNSDGSATDLSALSLPIMMPGQVLCPNDEDWYAIISGGILAEKIIVDVKFTQSRPLQDLDVYLYRDAPPSDMGAAGLVEVAKSIGTVSNEHAETTIPAGPLEFVYVKVVGKGTAGNTYELQIRAENP